MITSTIAACTGRLTIAYFDITYRLLLGSAEGRRFIVRAAPPATPSAHSYLTSGDLDALLQWLDLSPGDAVVDLGCGYGEVAMEVHRRTGADVIGIEASGRALVEARRRFASARMERQVRALKLDFEAIPATLFGARAAYEIDALMFVPSHWDIYASLLRKMGSGSRVFATTLEFGRSDPVRTYRRLRDTGMSVERLDDVSEGMALVSELRRSTALNLARSRSASLRGRLAMLLIVIEETTIRGLFRRGLVRRWRISAAVSDA